MAMTKDFALNRMTVQGPFVSVRPAAARAARRLAILALVGGMSAMLSVLVSAPANAQMLGMTMTQIAGPFAGRMNAAGGMAAGYGSQAGAFAHLMQGTQVMLPSMQNSVSALNGMRMASTSETAAGGNMTMSQNSPGKSGEPGGKSGEKSGGDVPDTGDAGGGFLDLMIGACAGGAFIGGFSAATATAPVAVTGVATPIAATAVASAMGVGCALGVATAAVSLGAVKGWQSATR